MNMRVPIILGAAATCIAATSYVAFGGVRVDRNLGLPAYFKSTVTADACSNNPGPYITMDGEIGISGFDAKLIFRNNAKGTHERTEDVAVTVSLLSDKVIKFAKQPPLGGVGGNPWIFLQLYDGNWDEISNKILLGRCVQGLKPVAFDYLHLSKVGMSIAADCSNSPGPYISLNGEMSIGGINAKLIFQNSPHDNAPHKRSESVELKIEILKAGDSITFAKQPPLGGVGGNPRIYLQFCTKDGKALSKEFYLGRCVQLSKDK